MRPDAGKTRADVAGGATVAACGLAILLLAFGASPARAEIVSVRLAGDTGAIWLLARQADGSYRIAVKPINQKWQRPWPRPLLDVAVVAGVRDSAVVFFAGGGLMRCFPDQTDGHPGITAPGSLWPAGTAALAACAAGGEPPDAVLVLVRRPVRPRAATSTRPSATTAPAPGKAVTRPAGDRARHPEASEELAILRYAAQQWQEVDIVPVSLAAGPVKALMAADSKAVYVLLEPPEQAALDLWALEEGKWRRIALPAELKGARPLVMTPMAKGIVLAALGVKARGQVGITRYASRRWRPVETVRRRGKPVAWDESAPPAAGRLGQNIAFVWREKDKWSFGKCGLDGRLSVGEIDIFGKPRSTPASGTAAHVLFWGMFGLIVVLMFWPGQPLRTAPFALPPTMLPAGLDRRGLAFLLDLLPFAIMAAVVGGVGGDAETLWREFKEGTLPDRLVYASLGFVVGGYQAYSIVMEYRFGATLGKMAMRLRVVGDGGRRASLREVALRNVSKVPELIATILVLFPVLTRYRQRLGDKIAWTAVIDAAVSLPAEMLEPEKESPDTKSDSDEEEKL